MARDGCKVGRFRLYPDILHARARRTSSDCDCHTLHHIAIPYIILLFNCLMITNSYPIHQQYQRVTALLGSRLQDLRIVALSITDQKQRPANPSHWLEKRVRIMASEKKTPLRKAFEDLSAINAEFSAVSAKRQEAMTAIHALTGKVGRNAPIIFGGQEWCVKLRKSTEGDTVVRTPEVYNPAEQKAQGATVLD